MSIEDLVPFKHPWPEERLDKLADVIVGGTPSTSVGAFWGGNIPWMSSGDVHFRRITSVHGRITQKGLSSSNATLVDPPAVVIALAGQGKTRGTVGLTFTQLCGNQSIAFIKPRSQELNASFLFHSLEIRYEELRARSAGGGRAGLSKGILEHLPICFPEPIEQREIVLFLDTADDAIVKTEVLIAKLKQIKAGLLHDLLTRGLDDNGQLREPESHPKQFRDSRLGRIPIDWDVVEFGSIVESAVLGTGLRGEDPIGQNVPLIKMGNVYWGGLVLDQVEMVSQSVVRNLEVWLLQSGDLLFNTRNTPDLVGKSAVWEGQFNQAVCDNNLLRIRFHKDIQSKLICAYMNHGKGKNRVHHMVTGTTSVAAIYWNAIKHFLIPIPCDPDEQLLIVEILDATDRRIRSEEAYLSKLKAIKKGLMHDLLTGRVRVPLKDGA